jgi:hypothetical protein
MSMIARLLCLVCALCLVSIASAHAQSSAVDRMGPIVGSGGRTRTVKPALPPALPGTAVGGDRQAPADATQTDLQPTDALFDAINRGDIAAARDALNRGADLNAHNVLGMTPLDESVDLSRNDITFLLMSLRGASPAPNNPSPTRTADKNAPPAKGSAPGKPEPRRPPVRQAASRPIASAPSPRPVAEAASERPPRGDSGTPNPQAGFLGFGG